MSDPKLTEERLKSWLDANQPQRERLCLHLLPILGNFKDVKPRRPKGGPDGSRDLEGLNKFEEIVWGAVGFQNTANDSKEQKKWITKKFKDDLDNALKKNEELKYFVFFTNVDLTPKEQDDLINYSYKRGIIKTEIFYREKLRQILDSPKGFGYRLQYLNIQMSQEEQVSFIENLQDDRKQELQEIKNQNLLLDEKIARIEFLNELNRTFTSATLEIVLDKEYSPSELKTFGAIISIKKIYENSPYPILNIGGTDGYIDINGKLKYGNRLLVYQDNPEKLIRNFNYSESKNTTNIISFGTQVYDSEFKIFSEFDRCSFDLFVSENLLEKIKYLSFNINSFELLNKDKSQLATAEDVGLTENSPPVLPIELSKSQKEIKWKRVYLRNELTYNKELIPPKRHNSREFHFSEFTPTKLKIAAYRKGRLGADMSMLIDGLN